MSAGEFCSQSRSNIDPTHSRPVQEMNWADTESELGSGLIDHSQKMMVTAMQIADMKVWAHRS